MNATADRPTTLLAAAVLNVVVGLGLLLLGLFAVAGMVMAAAASDLLVGTWLILSIPACGALATLTGILLWRRSAVGWWLAFLLDALGLALLVWLASLTLHPAAVAAAATGVAMVALVVAPSTPRAVLG